MQRKASGFPALPFKLLPAGAPWRTNGHDLVAFLMMDVQPLDRLLGEIRACQLCADRLPLGPRPVLHAKASARILIASQAPGSRVHDTGLSFNDRSGDRLRDWLGLDRATFYDDSRIAIAAMGFCYPGAAAKGGDNPPDPRCAPRWRQPLLNHLPAVALTLVIGSHAQRWHLGTACRPSMTATVAAFRDYLPRLIPLPHPSWRNTAWLKRHPWFETDLLPALRASVAALL